MKRIFLSLFIATTVAVGWANNNSSTLAEMNARMTLEEDVPEFIPDFTLPLYDGGELTLSSLRGKYVVLDFWGTWCGWCIKGMPKLKAYMEKYPGAFEIIGVDCGDREPKWREVVPTLDMPWKQVIIETRREVQRSYDLKGFPTKFIIDPEGRILKKFTGEDPRFYKALDDLFGGK